MSKTRIGLGVAITVLLITFFINLSIQSKKENKMSDTKLSQSNLKLSSPAFSNDTAIPAKYTCKGENINPPLQISGAPEGTLSLALIVHDPDAPSGDFTHWVVWNIDPHLEQINEGTPPPGSTDGRSDFGRSGYGGPCPPAGSHHYVFELYALDIKLDDLQRDATRAQLQAAMQGHVLGQATLTGLFGT